MVYGPPPHKQHIMADAAIPPLSDQNSPLLDLLPGEIRNQIIELCIVAALKKPRSATSMSKSKLNGLTVSVLPKWNGPGCLRLEGVRALPLLFVNKQLYHEVLSYVDSMVDELSIGGYILQFPNEDPRTRWRLVYSMLEKRPSLRRFVQDVKVSLPREGDELSKRHWASLGLPGLRTTGKQNSWLVLPGLEKSLANFSAIEKLVVSVTVEKSEPPNFSKLLPLYALFRDRITIEIVAPEFCGERRVGMVWVEKWRKAWEVCKDGG